MKYLLVILLLTAGIVGCKNSLEEGFYLERFEAINPQIDSLLTAFTDKVTKANTLDESEEGYSGNNFRVPIVILGNSDSLISIVFTSISRMEVNDFIFRDNYRVMGYINSDYSTDVILLADPANRASQMNKFYQLVSPLHENKQMPYIYYPKLYYQTIINNDTIKGILIPITDYRYFGYEYQDGRIYPTDEYSIF